MIIRKIPYFCKWIESILSKTYRTYRGVMLLSGMYEVDGFFNKGNKKGSSCFHARICGMVVPISVFGVF